jgi:excisionase family DNA binding protein
MTSDRAAGGARVPKSATKPTGKGIEAPEIRRLSVNGTGERRFAGVKSNGEPEGSLLDYEAAARYLCTTPRHIRELWAKRYLAAIKVGRRVRFSTRDLDAFIAARRVRALR